MTLRNVPRITKDYRAQLDEIEHDIAAERKHKRARNKKRKPKAAALVGLKKLGDFDLGAEDVREGE